MQNKISQVIANLALLTSAVLDITNLSVKILTTMVGSDEMVLHFAFNSLIWPVYNRQLINNTLPFTDAVLTRGDPPEEIGELCVVFFFQECQNIPSHLTHTPSPKKSKE